MSELLQKAIDENNEDLLTGVIPIVKELCNGRDEVEIIAFAYFTMNDVISSIEKDPLDEAKLYYAWGVEPSYMNSTTYAYGQDGKIEGSLLNGFADKPSAEAVYPLGSIIGHFNTEVGLITNISTVLSAEPNQDIDYNAVVAKLVE